MPLYPGRRGLQSPVQLSPQSLLSPVQRRYPSLNSNDPINNKLVGYWSMDAATITGTTLSDLSGQANHGTMVNTPTPQVGRVGRSMNFANGSSEYVDVGLMGTFGSQMANFSFTTWCKTTIANGSALAGCFNTGGTMGLNIYVSATNGQTNASGKLNFFIRDNAGTVCEYATTNATVANDNSWHHLAYVFDNSSSVPRMKIYVDAVSIPLTVNGTSTGPLSSFANWGFNMTIAARNVRGTIGAYLNGNMDDVRFYARSLTPGDVMRLYTNTSGSLGMRSSVRRFPAVPVVVPHSRFRQPYMIGMGAGGPFFKNHVD